MDCTCLWVSSAAQFISLRFNFTHGLFHYLRVNEKWKVMYVQCSCWECQIRTTAICMGLDSYDNRMNLCSRRIRNKTNLFYVCFRFNSYYLLHNIFYSEFKKQIHDIDVYNYLVGNLNSGKTNSKQCLIPLRSHYRDSSWLWTHLDLHSPCHFFHHDKV